MSFAYLPVRHEKRYNQKTHVIKVGWEYEIAISFFPGFSSNNIVLNEKCKNMVCVFCVLEVAMNTLRNELQSFIKFS